MQDIAKMYERVRIQKGTDVPKRTLPNIGRIDEKKILVFVHGWRMSEDDYLEFSQSMMKRLYWAGFQGRFVSVRWQTYSSDDYLIPLQALISYNISEQIAYKAGAGLARYLRDLRGENPSWQIALTAHSMGNVVSMEMLKLQREAGRTVQNADIDNYVLLQAALPAHSYPHLGQDLTNTVPNLIGTFSTFTVSTRTC